MTTRKFSLAPLGNWTKIPSVVKTAACLPQRMSNPGYFSVFNTVNSTPTFSFFLNHKPDALINPILFCYKTLHVSGLFSAHHQEFYTLHSALVNFMQVSDDHFRAQSGWNFHPDSAWKRSSETCMKRISAECTVENSWWWAEKMPETCRVL